MKRLLFTSFLGISLLFGSYNAFADSKADAMLLKAVKSRDVLTVEKALEIGANANQSSDKPPYESLIAVATNNGDIQIVKLLISAGANINQTDRWNGTAVHCAAVHGYSEILKYLIANGGNYTSKCLEEGTTPIELATDEKNKFEEIINIIKNGEEIKSNNTYKIEKKTIGIDYINGDVFNNKEQITKFGEGMLEEIYIKDGYVYDTSDSTSKYKIINKTSTSFTAQHVITYDSGIKDTKKYTIKGKLVGDVFKFGQSTVIYKRNKALSGNSKLIDKEIKELNKLINR